MSLIERSQMKAKTNQMEIIDQPKDLLKPTKAVR